MAGDEGGEGVLRRERTVGAGLRVGKEGAEDGDW